MFLGAILKTLKGGYDAVTIRKKLKEFKEKLAEELLGGFSAYERFLATEQLIAAEYMIQLSKIKAQHYGIMEMIKLREKVHLQMKRAVETAQMELGARNATKLDVAKLVSNLRELSISIDKDFLNFRNEVGAEQEKIEKDIHRLEQKLKTQNERLERQTQRSQSLERKSQEISENLQGLTTDFKSFRHLMTRRALLIWVFNCFVVLMIFLLIWSK